MTATTQELIERQKRPALPKWDIETTAEEIARNHSQYKGGRLHADWYGPAKAAALEALTTARNQRDIEIAQLEAENEALRRDVLAVLDAISEDGRITSGGIRRPAKYIQIPAEHFATARALRDRLKGGVDG